MDRFAGCDRQRAAPSSPVSAIGFASSSTTSASASVAPLSSTATRLRSTAPARRVRRTGWPRLATATRRGSWPGAEISSVAFDLAPRTPRSRLPRPRRERPRTTGLVPVAAVDRPPPRRAGDDRLAVGVEDSKRHRIRAFEKLEATQLDRVDHLHLVAGWYASRRGGADPVEPRLGSLEREQSGSVRRWRGRRSAPARREATARFGIRIESAQKLDSHRRRARGLAAKRSAHRRRAVSLATAPRGQGVMRSQPPPRRGDAQREQSTYGSSRSREKSLHPGEASGWRGLSPVAQLAIEELFHPLVEVPVRRVGERVLLVGIDRLLEFLAGLDQLARQHDRVLRMDVVVAGAVHQE